MDSWDNRQGAFEMEIKILGTGCAKCHKLYEETKNAVAQTGVDANVEKVEDLDKIASYGVFMTPALVVDGEVKSSGKIPKTTQIIEWLKAKQ